jgi:tetratricopeptide (TPR) repeat protein
MAEEEFLPEEQAESGENAMLREAIEALRQGDRVRARDLLTRLLKSDQKNATYWVWLSAAVDTHKERLYCLQTALQIDPQNAAARRGLILLGALPPDDAVAPFPLNRPRSWEETLKVSEEPPRPSAKRGLANPLVRLAVIAGVSLVALAVFYFIFIIAPRQASPYNRGTPFRQPTATLTPTPTSTPLYRTATPTFLAPTPLAMLLPAPYTPTPLYVVTEHFAQSRDAFNAAINYFKQGQCQNAIPLFEQVLTIEPEAADAYYYLGECYRLAGDYRAALNAYERAIALNSNFGPPFLGRAIIYHLLDPDADVISYYDEATAVDPNFTLAYIERGAYYLDRREWNNALRDLQIASNQDPNSAITYMYMAQAQLALGRDAEALQSAERANQLDITLLPVYRILGETYYANERYADAVGVLQLYTLYETGDAQAYLMLGTAYNATGDYQSAIRALDRSLSLNRHNGEAYAQRGEAYLNLGNPEAAERDFKRALAYDSNDFDASFGLAMAYYAQEHFGDAYLQLESALGRADTDEERAKAIYWEALCLERINDPTSANRTWRRLLTLPEEAMPAEWRNQAYERLGVTPTWTPTPRPTRTPTPTAEP